MIQKHHAVGVNTTNNMLTQINEEKLAVLIFTLCAQRPVMYQFSLCVCVFYRCFILCTNKHIVIAK